MAFGGKVDDGISTFVYEAVSPSGKRVKERMTAASAGAVSAALQAEDWIPIYIQPERGMNLDIGAKFGNRPLKLKVAEMASFSRQLHQLLKAGIAVPKALSSLGEEQAPARERTCNEIASQVQAGVPVSEAFAAFPKAFDEIFCSYIAAGEQAGTLVETTGRLAHMMEKKAALSNKVKSVSTYPKMVGGAIGMLVIGIIMFLVPQYAKIYAEFGAALPGPTQMLVDISKKMPLVLGGVGAAIFGFRYWLKATADNIEIGEKVDRIKYKFPIFGPLGKKSMLYRWASTLSGAMESGVPMYDALDLAARASGSRWNRAVSVEIIDTVRSGRQMSQTLKEHSDLFPVNVRTMVSTGESTGEVSTMLESVATTLDDELDAMVGSLGSKIEVALLMTMGVVVGGLLVVLYMPILQLASTAQSGMS